jgi:hypothetical protein
MTHACARAQKGEMAEALVKYLEQVRLADEQVKAARAEEKEKRDVDAVLQNLTTSTEIFTDPAQNRILLQQQILAMKPEILLQVYDRYEDGDGEVPRKIMGAITSIFVRLPTPGSSDLAPAPLTPASFRNTDRFLAMFMLYVPWAHRWDDRKCTGFALYHLVKNPERAIRDLNLKEAYVSKALFIIASGTERLFYTRFQQAIGEAQTDELAERLRVGRSTRVIIPVTIPAAKERFFKFYLKYVDMYLREARGKGLSVESCSEDFWGDYPPGS